MKPEYIYSCQECGAQYHKWVGRCYECGKWGSLCQERVGAAAPGIVSASSHGASRVEGVAFSDLSSPNANVIRVQSGLAEFDNVCGGGIVNGTSILIGGSPGIGKSTMLLQVLAGLAQQGKKCVYFSGEESVAQICIRAQRLGLSQADIKLASETSLEKIMASLDGSEDYIVIDSVQTLSSDSVESFAGSVSQVKVCSNSLIHHAKHNGLTIFLVGHINKDGALAGPKILEHMVDTVLYFEEESANTYRILRSIKNRYGPCDEIAIFSMHSNGLEGVHNPSALFVSNREQPIAGCVVFAGIHGNRPLMVEIQALVSKSYSQSPRRTVVGWDINRLFMLLAVLENKARMTFYDRDVYLSVTGGLKISEPAADLAVAAALISARNNSTLPATACMFGEIGLTGEVRKAARDIDRMREAQKLGFNTVYARDISSDSAPHNNAGSALDAHDIRSVFELAQLLSGNE